MVCVLHKTICAAKANGPCDASYTVSFLGMFFLSPGEVVCRLQCALVRLVSVCLVKS